MNYKKMNYKKYEQILEDKKDTVKVLTRALESAKIEVEVWEDHFKRMSK